MMAILEAAVSGLAKTVTTAATKQWLGHRRQKTDASLDLSDLLTTSIRDRFVRQKFELQVGAIINEVAERISLNFAEEFRSLPSNECAAALEAVRAVFVSCSLTDESLFAADADAGKMYDAIRQPLDSACIDALLSEQGRVLARRVMQDTIRCYVEIARYHPQFINRASQEALGRLSRLSADVADLLTRIPAQRTAPTLEAGSFTNSYMSLISEFYDHLDLFGVDVRNFSPEMTLSVAYLELNVSRPDRISSKPRISRRRVPTRRLFNSGPGDEYQSQIENALSDFRRILIRGEAGSGKSTLLRWIAVTASREQFTGPLTRWNGKIPFLVKLRSYADKQLPDVGPALGDELASMANEVPDGWVTNLFENDDAILLVDGVDELVMSQRAAVRTWLRRILTRFPKLPVVITSRPAAASDRWLAKESFTPLGLERMTPPAIALFLKRWHKAIAFADNLPCPINELPKFERRLLSRLEANGHLRELATNPLMCAMLCALNLDRGDDLPHDRITLYRAALDMLLERRDARREVPAYKQVALGAQYSISLLQDLAWRLTIGNRTELDLGRAKEYVDRRLKRMPRVEADTETVFIHMIDRSGVLKDVAEDRVSFVHRTFQEFLAAMEIAEEDHIDALIDQAHRDMWRETTIMTAGLASTPYRTRLIDGILDRANKSSPRLARRLRLLAGACVETAPALPVALIDRIDHDIQLLIPPRNKIEAQSLSLAGQRVLKFLPTDISSMSERAATATVRTCSYIGGDAALNLLAGYRRDPRDQIQQDLLKASEFFEPDGYGRRVLVDSPLNDGWVEIDSWSAAMLPHLKNLYGVRYNEPDLEPIYRNAPNIRGIRNWPTRFNELNNYHLLSRMTSIEHLEIGPQVSIEMLPDQLPNLVTMNLLIEADSTAWITRYPSIRQLYLYALDKFDSYAGLSALERLNDLTLSANRISDCRFLRQIAHLSRLCVINCNSPAFTRHVSSSHGELKSLTLWNYKGSSLDLAPLNDVSLRSLAIRDTNAVVDLAQLRTHQSLAEVEIFKAEGIENIGALANIESLKSVMITISKSSKMTADDPGLLPLLRRDDLMVRFEKEDEPPF